VSPPESSLLCLDKYGISGSRIKIPTLSLARIQSAPGQFWISGRMLHPTGDASLGYIDAKHEELAVDAGSTPGWVFRHHPEDQILNFLRQSFSTDLFLHLRDQGPVKSKSGTVPADHSFRSDYNERLFP
jgi:hypothetical protein